MTDRSNSATLASIAAIYRARTPEQGTWPIVMPVSMRLTPTLVEPAPVGYVFSTTNPRTVVM